MKLQETIRRIISEELNYTNKSVNIVYYSPENGVYDQEEVNNVQESIIVEEEDSKVSKLKYLINKIGIADVIKMVGGTNTLFNKINIDYNDIKEQEEIVKNYIYFNDLAEVKFLEVKHISSNKTIINVYIEPDTAANHTSWFSSNLCENFNKLFPFKIEPTWEFQWKKDKNTKIFINVEIFDDNHQNEDNIQESKDNVLKEETQLPTFIRRRIPVDELEKEFIESFDFAYNLIKRRKLLSIHELNELIRTTITVLIDSIHWVLTSTTPEDSEWYDYVYNILREYYEDRIIQMYNEKK